MAESIDFKQYKEYVLNQGHTYWPKGVTYIDSLPVSSSDNSVNGEKKSIEMAMIGLPSWALDISADGGLLVPKLSISKQTSCRPWEKVDWFFAAFWFLSGSAERQIENNSGPIHSYSYRLRDYDQRIWQRAWVNRIFLFLRRWSAKINGFSEDDVLGKLPKFKIHLTHDVDAVEKTLPVRIKQTTFLLFNGIKALRNRQYKTFSIFLLKGIKFAFLPCNYWCFEHIQKLEETFHFKSCFHFYAGDRKSNLKTWLLNPGYSIASHRLSVKLKELCKGGWQIGLHQGIENWSYARQMKENKDKLEKLTGKRVFQCRQHWLKFSWNKTWKTQEKAGFKVDTTLAFNDRPGFRTGTAFCYHPWDFNGRTSFKIKALPTVFMDSHFYDYEAMDVLERQTAIKYWIDEIKRVGGEAAVIWHQRVFAPDYAWGKGYEFVLKELSK